MRKKHAARQQVKSARTTTSPQVAPVLIPPVIAALAKLTDHELDNLPPEFIEAWSQVPAMVQSCLASAEWDLGVISHHSVCEDMTDREIAESRALKDPYINHLAAAIDTLNAANPDWLAAVDAAYSRPAFYVGLALGLYLLSNPAPVALRRSVANEGWHPSPQTAQSVARGSRAGAHTELPLGLRLLGKFTGIATEGALTHAHNAALTLAVTTRGQDDCNSTYSAIGCLANGLDADFLDNEDAVAAAFRSQHGITDDRYGNWVVTKTDAAFLLGVAYTYVLMTAIDGKGGAR